jgi:hypothetical protein
MLMPERKYSVGDGYRYGFNGMEKSNEIVEDNSYSSEFWEYDSRIGFRWNIDPKPNTSSSPFSVFACNPILFSDPRGDTARIKWGGLLGNKNSISYVGGNWIDTKTRQSFIANDKTPGRVTRNMSDYITLHSISGLDDMMKSINSSTNSIYLRTDGRSTDLSKIKAAEERGENGLVEGINVGSMNSQIEGALNFNGKTINLPSYVVLAHELGHVYDYLSNGWKFFVEKYQTSDPNVENKVVTWSEINAMYFENIARAHANISPRIFYSMNSSTGIPDMEGNSIMSQGPGELIRLRNGRTRMYYPFTFMGPMKNAPAITLLFPFDTVQPSTKKKK